MPRAFMVKKVSVSPGKRTWSQALEREIGTTYTPVACRRQPVPQSPAPAAPHGWNTSSAVVTSLLPNCPPALPWRRRDQTLGGRLMMCVPISSAPRSSSRLDARGATRCVPRATGARMPGVPEGVPRAAYAQAPSEVSQRDQEAPVQLLWEGLQRHLRPQEARSHTHRCAALQVQPLREGLHPALLARVPPAQDPRHRAALRLQGAPQQAVRVRGVRPHRPGAGHSAAPPAGRSPPQRVCCCRGQRRASRQGEGKGGDVHELPCI
ncbi:uncharacterized protein ovol1b isoform X2 [Scleropages formosus]|uniref:uncharacterized protein ovol1b isoform X2 n=1 Tax=Scleropages formosus TaxID=113540 RepID=UPI0008790891|nr:uncharacterized protein LOC108920274 isoform X2 [Scleropages formosus]